MICLPKTAEAKDKALSPKEIVTQGGGSVWGREWEQKEEISKALRSNRQGSRTKT